VVELAVENTSGHTIFVSSHYPFFEVNRRLVFDRARAWGRRLDLPAGDGVRFRPGETVTVRLVPYAGRRVLRGFNGLTDGPATPERLAAGLRRAAERGYGHRAWGGSVQTPGSVQSPDPVQSPESSVQRPDAGQGRASAG
jgi:urease subunit gamma/beta